MKRRFPLYLKIVLWFLLNLLLLGVVGLIILEGKFGLDMLVSGPVSHRIAVVSEAIISELRARPVSDWNLVLENRSANYGVKFLLFEDDGTQLAGETTLLPADVRQRLRGPEWHGPGAGRTHGRFEENRFVLPTNAPAFRFPLPPPRFVVRTSSPTRYWIGMPAFLGRQPGEAPHFATLVIASRNLYGGGLFFDAKPLFIAALWVLLFSTLFWFPLVRGITRSLSQMTRATERIAEGQFDVRVPVRRRDELGQLGGSVNRMAERLEGFVSGQKRFLGDTAHELCTPLARVQMAVGILEQRSTEATTQSYVQDVREEVQHMSELVAELLSFSKASLARAEVKLQRIKLHSIVEKAVERETEPGSNLQIEIPPDVEVLGDSDLLQRAVANLIRNALRYAGANGPIRICSRDEAGFVLLSIIDSGPGVPEEFLQRLFDPFFRLDDARTRETGGVGLGLTIVRTCVEACGGSVSCRNCTPSGLEVSIRLYPAGASAGK